MARWPVSGIITEEQRVADLREIYSLDPDASVIELARLRRRSLPPLASLIARIQANTGLPSTANQKNLRTAIAKAQRPEIRKHKPWFKLAHLRDLLRFRTSLTTIDQFDAVLSVFADEQRANRLSIVKIDTAKLSAPKAFGWRMLATDLRLPTGMLVEHYMTFGDCIAANDAWLHKIFEKWRGDNLDTRRKREAVRRDMELSSAANSALFHRRAAPGLVAGDALYATAGNALSGLDQAIAARLDI